MKKINEFYDNYAFTLYIFAFIILALDVYYIFAIKYDESFKKNITDSYVGYKIETYVERSDNLMCSDNNCTFKSKTNKEYNITYFDSNLKINEYDIDIDSFASIYRIFEFKNKYLFVIKKYYDGRAILYMFDNNLKFIKSLDCYIDDTYSVLFDYDKIVIYSSKNIDDIYSDNYQYIITEKNNKINTIMQKVEKMDDNL